MASYICFCYGGYVNQAMNEARLGILEQSFVTLSAQLQGITQILVGLHAGLAHNEGRGAARKSGGRTGNVSSRGRQGHLRAESSVHVGRKRNAPDLRTPLTGLMHSSFFVSLQYIWLLFAHIIS